MFAIFRQKMIKTKNYMMNDLIPKMNSDVVEY